MLEACKANAWSDVCIKKKYQIADAAPVFSWGIAANDVFDSIFFFAWGGLILFFWLPVEAFLVFLTDVKPTFGIGDTWEHLGWFEKFWYLQLNETIVAFRPYAFAASQLFTLGESKLSEYSMFYMDNTEAALYLIIEWLCTPLLWLTSVFSLIFTWWIYLAWGIYVLVRMIFSIS